MVRASIGRWLGKSAGCGTFAEPSKVTIGELFDDLLRDYEINGKSLDWASIVVEKHLRPFLGNVRAARVTSDLLTGYIHGRRAEGAAKRNH